MIWKTRRHGIIWLIDGGLVTSILIVNERYVSTNKRMGKTTKILNEMILMDLQKSFLHFYGFFSQARVAEFIDIYYLWSASILLEKGYFENVNKVHDWVWNDCHADNYSYRDRYIDKLNFHIGR